MRVPRTFVFVDLSGFTNYTAAFGDNAAGRILEHVPHDRARVGSDRGVRIAKWLGDGCMVVGVDQIDAIAFVLDLEHRAADVCAPLTLRAGIASGHALLFEGDDYIGSAVNMAARLCDVAEQYEVLMPTMQLDRLPEGVTPSRTARSSCAASPGWSTWYGSLASPCSRRPRHRRALDPQPVRLMPDQARRGVAFSTPSTIGTAVASDLGQVRATDFSPGGPTTSTPWPSSECGPCDCRSTGRGCSRDRGT